MNPAAPGRRSLALALAVQRGHCTASFAKSALLRGPAGEGGPAELLGELWGAIPEGEREAILADFDRLTADPDGARRVIGIAGLKEAADSMSLPAFAATLRPAADVRIPAAGSSSMESTRFEVRSEHARGGMGRILIAWDARLGREVALKELLPGIGATVAAGAPGRATALDAADRERFFREARVTGQLEHPGIVPVYEMGERDGCPFYAMRLVRGETLGARLDRISREEKDPAKRVEARLRLLDAFVDVCDAVAYAHARGVINRDLKPANVMLGNFGETFVLDWGLARVRGQEDRALPDLRRAAESLRAAAATGAPGLTLDGSILGTPAYMPPEQARGELDKIDERSDVYALGAILFELLTGHPPHEGPHPVTVLQSVIHGAPPQATTIEPHAPPDLAAIAHKALSREPSDRFQSARALADEVRARRDGRALTVYRYSLVEQIRGFVRRNRALAAALAFSMITLIAGTAASLYWGEKASRESEAARRAQIETDKRAAGERVALKETREALRRADGLRLAATALTLERDTPSSALALALEAADRAPGAEANNALLAALSRLQERRRLYGHDFYVLAVAWSPSGARVATAGREFQAMVWDAGTGQALRRLAGHHGIVVQVEFSPDGTRLLTGAEDGTVRVWDVESGAAVATLGPLHTGVANGSWHPRGTQVLVWGPRTAIWPASGGAATDLEGVADPSVHAAWNPSGTLVAVAPKEADAGVWDAATGRRRAVFAGCRALSVLWTPDGTRVVTAGPGGAGLWDPADGRRLATIGPGEDLAEAAIDPASTRLATRDGKGQVRFWNFADFTETAHPIGTVSLLAGAFSPDGSRFLRTADTTVDVIDIASGAVLSSLRGHGYTVSAARFDPTGARIATSSCDLTACLWDASPGGAIPRVALPPEAPVIAIDAARSRVLVAPREGEALWVDGNGRTSRAPFGVLKSGTDRIEIAPGHAVAVSSREGLGPFRLWDLETDRELGPWPAVKNADGVALAADRELVACWHSQGDTTVLEARTGREVFRRSSTRERVGDVPAADGVRLLELNPSHGEVRLTNAANETLSTLRGHTGDILQAYFLAGERTAVTFAADSSILKWDLGTGRQLASHTLQRMGEGRLVRSRDGKYLAVVASDFIRVIDTSDLREVFTLPGNQALAAAFSNDGTTLLAADRPGSLALVPLDVLTFARRLAPRPILPGELRRYEVGSPEERHNAAEAWDARFPSGVRTMLLANQAFNEGRLADALALARRATETCPTYPDCWNALLRMALAQPPETRDLKEAFRALREYVRRGMSHAADFRKDPILDPLKSSPEFEEILKEAPFE